MPKARTMKIARVCVEVFEGGGCEVILLPHGRCPESIERAHTLDLPGLAQAIAGFHAKALRYHEEEANGNKD